MKPKDHRKRLMEAKKNDKKTDKKLVSKKEMGEWEFEDIRNIARRILATTSFDVFICTIIGANAVTIGLGQTLELSGSDTLGVSIAENIFLVFYILEFILRFLDAGLHCLREHWIKFDLLLILLGVVTSWIVEPFFDPNSKFISILLVLRTARLLRLAKTVRMLAQVKDFWILVRGFLNSMTSMMYTLSAMFVCIYVYSVIALEVITKTAQGTDDEDFQRQVDKYFSSIPQAMFTLMRFTCLDNMSDVYEPLVAKYPAIAIYFICVTLSISIILYHLYGAVIFSSMILTIEQHAMDQDNHRTDNAENFEQMVWRLKDLFERIDSDKSGQLSKEEIIGMDPKDITRLTNALGVQTPMEIFSRLDYDKSGQVSISEFLQGVRESIVKRGNGQIGMKRMEKQVENLHWCMQETYSLLHEVRLQVSQMKADIKRLKSGGLLPLGQHSSASSVDRLSDGEDALQRVESIDLLRMNLEATLDLTFERIKMQMNSKLPSNWEGRRASHDSQASPASLSVKRERGTPLRNFDSSGISSIDSFASAGAYAIARARAAEHMSGLSRKHSNTKGPQSDGGSSLPDESQMSDLLGSEISDGSSGLSVLAKDDPYRPPRRGSKNRTRRDVQQPVAVKIETVIC